MMGHVPGRGSRVVVPGALLPVLVLSIRGERVRERLRARPGWVEDATLVEAPRRADLLPRQQLVGVWVPSVVEDLAARVATGPALEEPGGLARFRAVSLGATPQQEPQPKSDQRHRVLPQQHGSSRAHAGAQERRSRAYARVV